MTHEQELENTLREIKDTYNYCLQERDKGYGEKALFIKYGMALGKIRILCERVLGEEE